MIQLKNVSKNYGSVVALCPTDLSIEKGKVTTLIGPSGCGKSTILRLIAGLEDITAGFDRLHHGEGARQVILF